jgi:hypothetical protein
LKVGANLIIKAVVQLKNDKVIVKIKNNGIPFAAQPPGSLFQRNQIQYNNKNFIFGLLGGRKMGLKSIEEGLKEIGANIFLKNRKKAGAAVYIEFDAKQNNAYRPINK